MIKERTSGRLSLVHKTGDKTPDRLKEFFQQWENEAATQREAAAARAQVRIAYEEWRRERAAAADLAYVREITRLNREYEQKIARLNRARERELEEARRRADELEAVRQTELNRRKVIWEQSVEQDHDGRKIDVGSFDNDQPVKVRFGEYCRPDPDKVWVGYSRRDCNQSWHYRGEHRERLAAKMVEALRQSTRWRPHGRGARSPRKQPRGWEASLPKSWSRREYIEAKWQHLFE